MTEEQRKLWDSLSRFVSQPNGRYSHADGQLILAADAHIRELQARIRECDCPCCRGTGKFGVEKLCSECKGTGKMCLAYETARGHEKLGRERIAALEARVNELESDFEGCEKEVGEVYRTLTNNKFSNMNTRAQVILDEAEAETQRAIAEEVGVEHEYALHLEALIKLADDFMDKTLSQPQLRWSTAEKIRSEATRIRAKERT